MTEQPVNTNQTLAETYSPKIAQYILILLLVLLGLGTLALYKITLPVYICLLYGLMASFVLIFFPRIAFYLFMILLFFYIPQRISYFFSVHPFDVMMGILTLGIIFEYLLRTRTEIRPSTFDWMFLVLISATFVSAFFAYNPRYSIVPCFRIVVVYFAFRVVFKYGLEIGIRRILLFYIYLVFIFSLYNSVMFYIIGGRYRVFGPAELGFETLSMTALPMSLAFMIWAKKRTSQLKFGLISMVIGFAILATQSRAPLLAVVIAIPVLIFFAHLKAKREKNTRAVKTIKLIYIPVVILLIIFIVSRETLFAYSLGRYELFIESFTSPKGTVALRIVQWTLAVKTFLDHPLTGVGIGNFRVIHELYPDIRVVPNFFYVKGMSAHNVVLHYLAETGLIGALALVALAWRGMKTGYRNFREKVSEENTQVAAALFITMFVFCVTILYMRAWTWGQGGYVLAILFGLTAAYRYEQRSVEKK